MICVIISFILLLPSVIHCAWKDLEEYKQDFVLETKQIHIPEFPGSFNPTLIRWDDALILMFRIRDSDGNTDQNGFVLLDNDLQIISKPKLVEISFAEPQVYSKVQDPRIVAVGDEYYIVFNNVIDIISSKEMRRMYVAKLTFDGENLYANHAECLLHFDAPEDQLQEKNWVPFAYKGNLYLSYSINPHYILKPILGTSSCIPIASSKRKISWDWGELRGGTPALLLEDQYLAFFHSSKNIKTIHSHGESISHYFMGAYTFSKTPPFQITAISPSPIIGENFYHGKTYNTWKPLMVVFPCGFVYDDQYVWVAYGRQDFEIWIAKLDKKKLLQSLKPVKTSKIHMHQDTL